MPDIPNGFRMTNAEFLDLDEHGNGIKLTVEKGIWRAWKMENDKPVSKSSGGWRTPEEALKVLNKEKGKKR